MPSTAASAPAAATPEPTPEPTPAPATAPVAAPTAAAHGGSADAERLPVDPSTGVAEIPSKTTPVQSLLEDAPDVLKQAQVVLDGIGRFTTRDNAENVAQMLANLNASSGQLDKVMADLSTALV